MCSSDLSVMIEARGVQKWYPNGFHALRGCDLVVNRGEVVVVMGPSGSGKSTLMKMIAGVGGYRADSGQIQIARGTTVGYLSQEFSFGSHERTLRQEAETAFERLHALHDELNRLTHDMTEAQGDALDKLLKRYEEVERQVEAAGATRSITKSIRHSMAWASMTNCSKSL